MLTCVRTMEHVNNVNTTHFQVKFNPNVQVRTMSDWSMEYHEARISNWKRVYLDRLRFERKIFLCGIIISRILTTEHRQKIYSTRFGDIDQSI